jgi:hypothetical protein
VVIGVQDGTMLTLTNVKSGSLITSPVTLEGTGAAFEAVIGRAVIYDHLYTAIGHAQMASMTNGMGQGAYSTKVLYTSSFRSGMQEGIVAVYEDNGGISDEIYTAVLVKVLLDPEPGVALGPLPCPDVVSNPAHWTPLLSAIRPNPVVAEQVSCGNLLGQPSLQAMVVGREIVGGSPTFRSVFAFDHILDAHQHMLFKLVHLPHGEALISGYSTVMTGEVDLNSSLNKGKPDAQMTIDLFREFQWSPGTDTFVQAVFPGLYPDLTRYQAEQDQLAVNQGQASWKNDATVVARSLTVDLLKWSSTSQATMVSGGGPLVGPVPSMELLLGQ